MGGKIDIKPGARFGGLVTRTVIGSGKKGVTWLCVCDCGRITRRANTELNRGRRTCCGLCWYQFGPRAMRELPPPLTWSESFLSQIKIPVEPVDCWEWGGLISADGYGRFKIGRGDFRAHRASWFLMYGPVPAGLVLLHLCDNPRCVNPDHLAAGSQSANLNDAIRKGRAHAKVAA